MKVPSGCPIRGDGCESPKFGFLGGMRETAVQPPTLTPKTIEIRQLRCWDAVSQQPFRFSCSLDIRGRSLIS